MAITKFAATLLGPANLVQHLPIAGARWFARGLLLALSSAAACHRGGGADPAAAGEIRGLLARQVERWNAGDLVGFMDGYQRSEQLRFQSGGDVQLGWQNVLDRYRRRYGNDRAGMGTLTFSDLQVEPLDAENALAYGRWRVQGARGAAAELSGLFTLVLSKTPGGWRIRFDHTSAR
jgi:beta-aspartyl-peptidase (threonine type)